MSVRTYLLSLIGILVLSDSTFGQVTGSITTTFVSNNGNSINGGNYFDVNVLNAAGLTITGLDINANSAATGNSVTINVWTRSGTSTGFEANPAGWTLVSTGVGVAAGQDVPTFIDIPDFTLPPGLTGFAINNQDFGFRYTNGTTTVSNSDVSLTLGTASNSFFVGGAIAPGRIWNGTMHYTVVPEPGTLTLTGIVLGAGAGWRRLRRK